MAMAAKKAVDFFIKHPHLDLHHALSIRQFKYLNAYKSKSFTEAIVEFEQDDVHHNYAVRLQKIFEEGFVCLEKYRVNDIDNLSETQKESLQCLVNFFEEKDGHLECLAPFMLKAKGHTVNASETDKVSMEEKYTLLLAEHLFGPLTPGECYLFDRICFPKALKECPGGCQTKHLDTTKKVQLRNTGMGHPDVWHGFADIYLETGVSVVVKTDDESVNDSEEEGGECNLGDVSESEHVRKQEKRSSNYFAKSENGTLGSDDTIAQATSQTIVNAFIQKEKCLLIPTLCTSFGSIKVYMYDPQHDIFMMSPKDCALELFDFESQTFLSDINIIYLWMILNFGVFSELTEKAIEDVESYGLQSGFPKFVGNKFNIYRENLEYGVSNFPAGACECPAVMHIFIG